MGHAAQVGIGAAGGASTRQLDFLSCGVIKDETHEDPNSIRAGRSHDHEGVAQGTYTVGGPLVLNPRPDDLDLILPYILGTAESVDVFALNETLIKFVLDVDKVANVYRYDNCKVNTATFRSGQGAQPLELELDIQGTTEATTTFPSIAATLTDISPYVHHQCVVTLNSTAYTDAFNVEITIDNSLILDRFGTSRTRVELPEGDRIITLTVGLPFSTTEETAFYDAAIGGIDGSVVYTNGGYSLDFTFIKLQRPERSPVINDKGQEIGYELTFTAREDHSAGTKELVVTSDAAA
jgi:hypothetical protein